MSRSHRALASRRIRSPRAVDGRTRCPLCPLHDTGAHPAPWGDRARAAAPLPGALAEAAAFQAALGLTWGTARRRRLRKGSPGSGGPHRPGLPPSPPPAPQHLGTHRPGHGSAGAIPHSGDASSLRGTAATAEPSAGSPRPLPPPPCGEAGRAPAEPPHPTPGRALTPRPGPASITSRSTFELLPPPQPPRPARAAPPGVAALRLVLRSRGAGLRRSPGTASGAGPPRGCSRPCRSSVSPGRGLVQNRTAAAAARQQPRIRGGAPGLVPGEAALPAAPSPLETPGGHRHFLPGFSGASRLVLGAGLREAIAFCSSSRPSPWASSCHVSPQKPPHRSPTLAVRLCPDTKLSGLFTSAAPWPSTPCSDSVS